MLATLSWRLHRFTALVEDLSLKEVPGTASPHTSFFCQPEAKWIRRTHPRYVQRTARRPSRDNPGNDFPHSQQDNPPRPDPGEKDFHPDPQPPGPGRNLSRGKKTYPIGWRTLDTVMLCTTIQTRFNSDVSHPVANYRNRRPERLPGHLGPSGPKPGSPPFTGIRFWSRLFLLFTAIGIATGIPMELSSA